MKLEYATLEITQITDHIPRVALSRVAASNAFNTQMAQELTELFEAIALYPQAHRVIILTGQGEKAFCAGGDLKERNGMSDDQWQQQHLVFERMARAILACPVPIIGAVNGAAFGGGCELVASLDFVYAVEYAQFAQTETKLGIMPGIGGTQTLARAIGERRAKELILSGKVFSAKDALEWGLVNATYKTLEDLNNAVEAIAKDIAANAPLAVKQAKQAIHKGLQMSLSDGMAFEIEAYNRLVSSQDRLEGVAAFNEKRAPNFTGN